MPMFTPSKTDPERSTVSYSYKELKKLHRIYKDIHMFSRIMEERSKDMNRMRAFWDEEMAFTARMQALIAKPLGDFIFTIMHSDGDVAIDRTDDPNQKEAPEADVGDKTPENTRNLRIVRMAAGGV